MSSTYTVSPKSLHDLREPHGRGPEPHLADAGDKSHPQHHNQHHPITPVDSNLLSPYSSQQYSSNTGSPDVNSYTPAESTATLGSYYQPSDFSSEFADDPFFGANFNDFEASNPSFLEVDDPSHFHFDDSHQATSTLSPTQNDVEEPSGYPISPSNSPPISMNHAFNENVNVSDKTHESVAPEALFNHRPSVNSAESGQSSPQLTPDTNGGSWSRSSTDSLAPAVITMAPQSPRVTVSVYGRDGERAVEEAERSFPPPSESPKTVRGAHSLAGDLAVEPAYSNMTDAAADAPAAWGPNSTEPKQRRGFAPGNRPSDEILSPNQEASRRSREERNEEVSDWIYKSAPMNSNTSDIPPSDNFGSYNNPTMTSYDNDNGVPEGDIPLGHTTENRHQDGRTYYRTDGPGGPITETDITIMRGLRTWGDAPALHEIQADRSQPETSQEAITRFMRQCQDNASMISRAATWGTRRRSLPSLVDQEGVLSGSFLKKLNLNTNTHSNHSRRSSFLGGLGKMVRRPSVGSRKRKGSNASELPPQDHQDEEDRRESKDSLAPPPRTSSWGLGGGNRKPTPSLNTALVGMATGAAAIGTAHARSGSVSATPVTSPKSPFGSFGNLSVPPVKNTLRRPRSKSELPKNNNADGPSALVGMLKKAGGPPVARLAGSQHPPDVDDDDDEDDENLDDPDMKAATGNLEGITPDVSGFTQHILRLNPQLKGTDNQILNKQLVDRIARQLEARYKQLCQARIDHLKLINQGSCPSGVMCVASGGSAIPLNNRGDTRGVDPLAVRQDSSDGDTTPLDGGITSDSFPLGIPMPPTTSLPAEFECQLCFCHKKFQKPSDWTKHVHEDVQPFTCTWECKEQMKVFKRKADWVRHENEGHRHLEWWTCDVDDCRHTCYRRDNFLQHLVREHKFTEPKVKTKAAIKKAGAADPTWQKVEQCHAETRELPQNEPCRFCGKTFATWKKLTVHLAKHMETISLPILKLVAIADLNADTIISPVQEAPPRSFPPPAVPVIKKEAPAFSTSPHPDPSTRASSMGYHEPAAFSPNYSNMSHHPLQAPPYYGQQATQPFTDLSSHPGTGLMMPQVTTGMNPQPSYQSMPVTAGPYAAPYMSLPSQGNMNQGSFQPQSMEQFPPFVDSLGIQDPTGTAMGYESFAGPSGMQQQNQQPSMDHQQYSSHGSVSPYSHSPHQGHGGFYNA